MKANKTQEYSIILWLIVAIGILIFCSSCKNEIVKIKNRNITLFSTDKYNTTVSNVKCDSVQMVSKNKCYYYIDGHRFVFYADNIRIVTN
jgi:hypothetical protein